MTDIRLKVSLTVEAEMKACPLPDGRVQETVSGIMVLLPNGMQQRRYSFELQETGQFIVSMEETQLVAASATIDWDKIPASMEDRSELDRWIVHIIIDTYCSLVPLLRADCVPKIHAYRMGWLTLEKVHTDIRRSFRTTFMVTPPLHSTIIAFFQSPF